MTQVTIKRNQEGKITRFTVKGHTGYADAGEDIVCAAASSVTWSTANGLENVLSIPITYTEKDGYADCIIPDLSPDLREKADVLLESMNAFFEELTRTHREFISKTEV